MHAEKPPCWPSRRADLYPIRHALGLVERTLMSARGQHTPQRKRKVSEDGVEETMLAMGAPCLLTRARRPPPKTGTLASSLSTTTNAVAFDGQLGSRGSACGGRLRESGFLGTGQEMNDSSPSADSPIVQPILLSQVELPLAWSVSGVATVKGVIDTQVLSGVSVSGRYEAGNERISHPGVQTATQG
ncbi:hypothetical protein P4O66_013246 [Electrophorus voltai]|uniref:Uncharacterized protein n=1 Tax=Electrophorus voltai TaxID=2609070 RepID=A0AAD8Z2G7_9TELE|nr:hypothetical protein P4O66_013246 [Electrophorus voltai]